MLISKWQEKTQITTAVFQIRCPSLPLKSPFTLLSEVLQWRNEKNGVLTVTLLNEDMLDTCFPQGFNYSCKRTLRRH